MFSNVFISIGNEDYTIGREDIENYGYDEWENEIDQYDCI